MNNLPQLRNLLNQYIMRNHIPTFGGGEGPESSEELLDAGTGFGNSIIPIFN